MVKLKKGFKKYFLKSLKDLGFTFLSPFRGLGQIPFRG
jgi:hypothetical protein